MTSPLSVDDDVDLAGTADYISISEAIEVICKDKRIRALAGGSGKGWSRFRRLQECPKKFQLSYIKKARGQASKALDVGTLFHLLLALHYGKFKITPEQFLELLLKQNINPEHLYEGQRLFEAYRVYYHDDYLIPLAVEEPAKDPETGLTCRYDLIARVDSTHKLAFGLIDGVYIVEHKTTSWLNEASVDGWDMDGEILGEVALWDKSGMTAKYGSLKGLIINLMPKTANPEPQRIIAAPASLRVKEHLSQLAEWEKLEKLHRVRNVWPRAYASCVNQYGKCDFYEYCRNGGT